MIPIRNLYYMLSYAFVSLQETTYKWLAHEQFENVYDLYAAIMAQAVSMQVKRGLWKGYREDTSPLSMLRGSVNVTQSIVQNTMLRHQLICSYDEFTEDVLPNRIVKTALERLLRSPVSRERKQALRKVMIYLNSVSCIDPKDIDWNLRYNRNNLSYQLLIGISRLVLTGNLQGTDEGTARLMDFDDIQRRSHLYEKFILNYYRREHKWLRAEASQVSWELEDDFTDLLPIMQTDITLSRGNDVLIIDAKYYGSVLQSYREARTIHSGNLYQIFTYVKNKNMSFEYQPHRVGGMLLYAKTDELVLPDGTYHTKGSNPISVKTLDLSQDFSGIRAQLDRIAYDFFGYPHERVEGRAILWHPDQSLPYVIHRKPGQFLDGTVIIHPEVVTRPDGTWFRFITNRGHLFRGRLAEHAASSMLFIREEGSLIDDGPYHISAMTTQEFEALQEEYRKCRYKIPTTMEELVEIYIEDSKWG